MTTGWLTGRIRDQSRPDIGAGLAIAALLASSRASGAATRSNTAHALAERRTAAQREGRSCCCPRAGRSRRSRRALRSRHARPRPWRPHAGPGRRARPRATAPALPAPSWTFWPLQDGRERVGVAGIEANALKPGSDEEKLVLALLDQGAVALERGRPGPGRGRGRDPAALGPLPRRPAELHQPRPAHAAVHRARLDHHHDRLWRGHAAGDAGGPTAERPRGGRAAQPLCRQSPRHDEAGIRRHCAE